MRSFSLLIISVFLASGLTTVSANAATQCSKTGSSANSNGLSNANSTSKSCTQAVAVKKPKIKSKPSKAEPAVSSFKRNNGFATSPQKCPKSSIC